MYIKIFIYVLFLASVSAQGREDVFAHRNKDESHINVSDDSSNVHPKYAGTYPKLSHGRDEKRILVLDGGGYRGAVLMSYYLMKFEEQLEKKFGANSPMARVVNHVDFVAGTSIGGIIALMLVCPKCPKNISVIRSMGKKMGMKSIPSHPLYKELFRKPVDPKYTAKDIFKIITSAEGQAIFGDKNWISSGFGTGFFGPKYSSKPLEELLKKEFGNILLSQCIAEVLIPAWCMGVSTSDEMGQPNQKAFTVNLPMVFRRYKAMKDEKDDFYIRDIARATSAAPTYFSPAIVPSQNQGKSKVHLICIDGGVFDNSPRLSALSEIIVLSLRETQRQKEKLPFSVPIKILNVGSGEAETETEPTMNLESIRNMGAGGWAQYLFSHVLTSGNPSSNDRIVKRLQKEINGLSAYHWTPVVRHGSIELSESTPENTINLIKDARESLEIDQEDDESSIIDIHMSWFIFGKEVNSEKELSEEEVAIDEMGELIGYEEKYGAMVNGLVARRPSSKHHYTFRRSFHPVKVAWGYQKEVAESST